jgi:hypothetical protein
MTGLNILMGASISTFNAFFRGFAGLGGESES